MRPQSKRRRLSLLTLPVVVAVGFLIVAKLAAWRRSDLIADLTDCIVHGESKDALAAVVKLASIPNPPLPVLVAAAASNEHETAGAAQVSIDRLLRRWQRDVESKKRYGTTASQLSELAKSLVETQAEFSDVDHAWLESTVRKTLRIANRFPPSRTPLVAVHCDAILTAIGAGRFPARLDELPGFDDVIAEKSDGKALAQPESAPLPDAGEEASQNGNEKSQSANDVLTPYKSPSTESLLHSGDDTAGNLPDVARADDVHIQIDESAENGAPDSVSSRPRFFRRADGSPPIFRVLPAMPMNVLPKDGEASDRVTPKPRPAAEGGAGASSDPLAGTDSRELLRTWLASANGDLQAIERELARRGFGKLSKILVTQFFSENPQDRIRLVDDVLAQPSGGSEAWLILLASDTDPDVRLFAVTFMATSNNAALVEKAWQAAIRDHDPRIADLAGRLREGAKDRCGGRDRRTGFSLSRVGRLKLVLLVKNRIKWIVHDFADFRARRPSLPVELLVLVRRFSQPHVDVHVNDREHTPRRRRSCSGRRGAASSRGGSSRRQVRTAPALRSIFAFRTASRICCSLSALISRSRPMCLRWLPRPKHSGPISIGTGCSGIQAVTLIRAGHRPILLIDVPRRESAGRLLV